MITLEQDHLKFSFSGLADELRQLISAELDRTTNRLIAEDRAKAFDQLVKTDRRYTILGETQKREMRAKLLALTPDSLRQAILSRSGQLYFLNRKLKYDCGASISFQRTLRIPDGGKSHPLPPGLGTFPVCLVDDHPETVPAAWLKRGGVMMPIYQAEALWLGFKSDYPCALKVGTGKISAVSGHSWTPTLGKNPQDYIILPEQTWLGGYCVKKGHIRQFVAMPLGGGYTAEEQLSCSAEHGGVQLQVYPLKVDYYFEKSIRPKFALKLIDVLPVLMPLTETLVSAAAVSYHQSAEGLSLSENFKVYCPAPDMGLGAGGKIRQEIYEDVHPLDAWDSSATSRCFVHLCNSAVWQRITSQKPPHPPVDAAVYAKHGLPWFDYYREDLAAIPGPSILKKLKSVFQISRDKAEPSLLEQKPVGPDLIIQYREKRRPDEVKEWVE